MSEDHPLKREELRGLFTLSILALLLVMRDKIAAVAVIWLPQAYVVMYPQSLIDILTIFWILYAILMIFRFSDDIIASEKKREYLGFLAVSSFLTGILIVTAAIISPLFVFSLLYFYPASLYFLLIFAATFIVVYLVLWKYRLHVVIEPRR
jgi:hypothetical protein